MSFEYVSLESAYEEAAVRLEDTTLQEGVMDYLGGVLPPGFDDATAPLAVYAPYLAKGSRTETDFLRKARRAGLKTVVATYKDAEYVTANAAAVDCFRPPLELLKGQKTRDYIVRKGVNYGFIGEAQTRYDGLDIVEYWEGIRSTVLTQKKWPTDDTVVDFGDWYKLQAERFGWQPTERAKSPYYYKALMALYASGRAVLFDLPPNKFDSDVVLPAARIAEQTFGVKPLVTNCLDVGKRDWVDLTFLSAEQEARLKETGRIGEK